MATDAPMITSDDVYQFNDFKVFLKAHFDDVKAGRPTWSLGAWARRLNLNATASLSMVLSGKRLPGPKMTESFVQYFKFSDPKKKKYFLDLIRLEKIKKDPEVWTLLVDRLEREHPVGKFRTLEAAQFETISKWYHYAIREMTHMRGFQEDPLWIQKRLQFHVPEREIEKAIQRLLELNMLYRDEKGRLKASNESIDTTADVFSEGLRRFHEDMIGNAKESVRKIDVLDREIKGTTFTIRQSAIPAAKEKIRTFIKNMIETLEAEQEGESTYQLNVQFFPLTKMLSNGKLTVGESTCIN